jgi:hypothetical protein
MRRLVAVVVLFSLGLVVAMLSVRPARAVDGVLTGTVGPGYTISLTQAGNAVTSLPAGTYEVDVTDSAPIHNFHLSGPGVDEATEITGTGSVTWTVTFHPGTYTYQCDAHPTLMHGSFTVTEAATTSTTSTDTSTTTAADTTTTAPDTTTSAPPPPATTDTTPTTTIATTTTTPTLTTVVDNPPTVHATVLKARRTGVRVQVRSSVAGLVAVARLMRGTQQVATAKAKLQTSRVTLTLQRHTPFRPGRYMVRVSVANGIFVGHATAALRIR